MKKLISAIFLSLLINNPASAVLVKGDNAPDFAVPTSDDVNVDTTSLSLYTLLSQGPVVLYFIPTVDSAACSSNLRMLSDSSNDFDEFHTKILAIPVFADEMVEGALLNDCESPIRIVPDPESMITRAYDVMTDQDLSTANGVSFVISPQTEIVHVYSSTDLNQHISESLEAVQAWTQLVDQEY